MTHPAVVGVALLVALLLVLEMLAVPLATRVVGNALGRCVEHGSLRIEQVTRPVVPRLLLGRAQGVVLRIEDAELEGLRVAEAVVEVPRAVLPWAIGDPGPSAATIHLRVDEADVADRLRDLTPLGIRPDVDLHDEVARVGLPGLSLELALTLEVRDDGVLVLQPRGGPSGWWERLGLAREIELPAGVRVDAVSLHEQALTATLQLDELPGVDGEGCDEPVATSCRAGGADEPPTAAADDTRPAVDLRATDA
jgi:hypothetical protein